MNIYCIFISKIGIVPDEGVKLGFRIDLIWVAHKKL